ncbi:MAG TPA: UDP-N-acetylmuramoyl-tripeptide--D-alanyl-D-alanine ligase [Candidatus Omnitrophota bacterium]|nr:UDP-N-acetylmuramoyl-tripeptide--D-alanyl-D-alanine ligase [Candidatus Omnitrophota bacterium]
MLTVQKIKEITNALSASADASTIVKGFSINTRTINRGEAFIAIKGPKFDGHDFIKEAVDKGAVAVIVSQKTAGFAGVPVIRVRDTTQALGQIAGWHRQRFDIPVIAITGSTGKTTTKEMVASVLARKYKVLKNVGTENNQYGVPLTLLKLNSSHEIAVLELGTNQPGDIRWLARITRPTVTIFTNIGESHLERLRSRAGVFREKSQMINYMDSRGLVIFNADDPYLRGLAKKRGRRKIIRVGCSSKVAYQAVNVCAKNNCGVQFQVNGYRFSLQTPAIHNVYNALSSISCGRAFKIRYNDIVVGLSRFKFRGGRQEIRKMGQMWLINDTYNANPVSFKSAIKTLDALHVRGRKIIVCADMLELGPQSRKLHESIGREIAQSTANVVVTMGRQARYIAQALRRLSSHVIARHSSDLKDVERQLNRICRPGDAILVKGSRGMHMERVVAYLEKHFK